MPFRKFAILGLGNFGTNLARTLHDADHDVLILDKDQAAVEAAEAFCSRAVVADAREKEALAQAGVAGVDVAVVSFGSRIDASSLATLHLRELGVERILAKAVSFDHERVLVRMGATEVVHPEREVAKRLAARLAHPEVIEEVNFMEGYALIRLGAPREYWGKTLAESDFRTRTGMVVVAVRRGGEADGVTLGATPDRVIEKGDLLIVLGERDKVEAYRRQRTER